MGAWLIFMASLGGGGATASRGCVHPTDAAVWSVVGSDAAVYAVAGSDEAIWSVSGSDESCPT